MISSPESIMRFFAHDHLPKELQLIAGSCECLAKAMQDALEPNKQFILGLTKLLEAKDCFIRAKLMGASNA